MSKDDGGPAFLMAGIPGVEFDRGMSLRDWFAGQALHCMKEYACGCENLDATIARLCYDLADAMIAERNRRKKS